MTLARVESTDTTETYAARGLPARSRAGTTGVTRLPGPCTGHSSGRVPLSAVQGTLALELDPYPGLPSTPELRLVAGGPPALRPWVARFIQAVVEVTSGDRGPQQLVRCMGRSVHRDLVERCAVLNAVASGEQRRSRLRPQVRSVHVQQPTPLSAEVTVHVRHGARSRALAARIELIDGHWWCVALEFG